LPTLGRYLPLKPLAEMGSETPKIAASGGGRTNPLRKY